MMRLLALLLLSSLAFAQLTPLGPVYLPLDWQALLGNVTPSLIAVMISVFVASLTYMLGSFFNLPKFNLMGKEMLMNSLSTVFLLFVIILPGVGIITLALSDLLFGSSAFTGCDIYDAARAFILMNYIYLFSILTVLLQLNIMVYIFLTHNISVHAFGKLVPIVSDILAKPILYGIGLTFNLLAFTITVNGFEYMLLGVVENAVLKIFLPLGIILRGLPKTFGMGNILIALSLGSYIILPATYLFDYRMMNMMSDSGTLPTVMEYYYSPSNLELLLSSGLVRKLTSELDTLQSVHEPLQITEGKSPVNKTVDLIAKAADEFVDRVPWPVKIGAGASATLDAATLLLYGAGQVYLSVSGGSALGPGYMRALKVMSATSGFIKMGILLYIMWYIRVIIEEVATSFVLLGIIFPVINLTMITVFVRDISRYMGTPIDLSHIMALI